METILTFSDIHKNHRTMLSGQNGK